MNLTDLRSLFDSTTDLPRTTTLLRESGLRAVVFHLKAGEAIPEHQTRGAITVQCLRGEAILLAGEERAEMTPAVLISLAPGVPHSVTAQQDTLLLITISEPVETDVPRAVSGQTQ